MKWLIEILLNVPPHPRIGHLKFIRLRNINLKKIKMNF
jgi:hypothetical protein